jgi:(4S)-4-hydroxy-5-phosphonooxypentane-2,3-dione isomerase
MAKFLPFDSATGEVVERCLAEEPGCLRFEVLRPLDDQNNPIPNRFMANKLFESQAALTAHRRTARFETISERFRVLLMSRGTELGSGLSIRANHRTLRATRCWTLRKLAHGRISACSR